MTQNPREEVLNGLAVADPNSAAGELDAVRIVVDATASQAALALSLVNLLARLIPNIELLVDTATEIVTPIFGRGSLKTLALSTVDSVRPHNAQVPRRSLKIVIGTTKTDADLYVSSSSWSLRLSRNPHKPLTGIGPATVAASALAAAEVIRLVVPELAGRRLRNELFEWNLLDYRCDVLPQEPSLTRVTAVCFGAGSVGSSIIYSLLLGGGAGDLVVVDPDRVTSRNLVRYPAMFAGATGAKTEWLERLSTGTPLHVLGARMTAAEFVQSSDPIQLAIAAVDTAEARREVGDALAKQTLNAGVAADQFHVSRHGFADGLACVYCGYVDVGHAKDAAAIYADMTGLAVHRTAQLLDGAGLTVADIDQLIASGSIGLEERDEFLGARLVDVGRQRLYSQVIPRGDLEQRPMAAPYVSALAGAILAAEMQKGDSKSHWLKRRIDVDCSGFPTGFQSKPPQDRSGNCLCASPFRVDAYKRMWLST